MAYFRIRDDWTVHHSQIVDACADTDGVAVIKLKGDSMARRIPVHFLDMVNRLPDDHPVVKALLIKNTAAS